MKKNKPKGFSLIEMVVVIVILGILVVLVVPSVTGSLKKGKETKATTDAAQLAAALNMYNTTLPVPIDESGLSDDTLEQELLNSRLLPKLSADYSYVIVNVTYDSTMKLFEAKSNPSLNGY